MRSLFDQKEKELSHQDFTVIEKQIKNNLTDTAQSINQLLVQLSTFSKEKIWTVLNFLQTEGELMISEDGQVSLLKP